MPVQPKPGQTEARTYSSFSPIPPVNTDQIDAFKHGDHRRDLLAHRIAEHVDCELGVGFNRALFCNCRMSPLTPDMPKKPGIAVDQILEHCGIQLLLARQVYQSARIEIAACAFP